MINLKPDGFYDGDRKVAESAEFFKYWRYELEVVDPATRVCDVIAWLKRLHPANVSMLEQLTCCTITPYLYGAADARVDEDLDEDPLSCVEVYAYAELDDYEGLSLTTNVAAHGIGSKPNPEFNGELTPYAIEFTPWSTLLPLPLRLNTRGRLCRTYWRDRLPTEQVSNFWESQTRLVDHMTTEDATFVITVGAFLTGLFTELCFFEHPKARDAKLDELQATLARALQDKES